MKYTEIFRMLSIALILSLLMLFIPATPALAVRSIELDPESGEIGDEITIIGEDYTASTETTERFVDIYFATDEAGTTDDIGDEVNTYQLLKTTGVGYEGDDDEGEFETTFEVPDELKDGSDDEDVEPGTYYIYVTRYDTTRIKAVAEFIVIGGGEITIDPDEGPVDTEVEIIGTDFGDRENIIIEYDGDEIDIESGDDETDRDGEFECTIIIPESTAGDHTITVTGDESGAEVEDTFTVEPGITISPTEANVEATVTVSGTGFASRSDIVVELDGTEVATATTDRDGSFEATFNAPALKSGTYDVEAWDEDDNSDKVKFTLTATTANLNPTTGHVGTEVTVSGTGYVSGTTVTIKYDTTEVGTATAATDGTFSATFKAPASKSGDHDVTASGDTTTKKFTFTMESEAPPIPRPLLPEMGVKVEPPVHFDWGDIDDPSGVTYTLQIATAKDFVDLTIELEKTELTKSEYTITEAEQLEPSEKDEPYYWRIKAVDGASNEGKWTGAGEFYVGAAFAMPSMPSWIMYLLFGLGALLIGILGFWLGRRTIYSSY